MDRARATLIVSTLSVVLASILAVGALTKPLLGGMLRDGGDAAIVARLDRVPLLGCAALRTHGRGLSCTAACAGGCLSGGPRAGGLLLGPWSGRCATWPRLALPPNQHRTRNTYRRIASTGALGDSEAPQTPLNGGGRGGGGVSALLPPPVAAARPGDSPASGGGGGGGLPASQRLPPAVRGIVDRLAALDRDILLPVFSTRPADATGVQLLEQQQQQQPPPAAGGQAQPPSQQQQQGQQPRPPAQPPDTFTLL